MAWSGLPFTLWQTVPFGDPDSWMDWLVHHTLHHRQLAERTRTRWVNLDDLRLAPDVHQQLHLDISAALGLAPSGDLVSYALDDRDQFATWMLIHAVDHQRLDQAAGS